MFLDGIQKYRNKASGRSKRIAGTAWQSQRGEGRLKAILFTAIFVAFIYVSIKIVPPYIAEFQLNDKMQEQARFAVVNRWTDEQVRTNIYKEIQDLGIPAKKEDIKVTANMQAVTISVEYHVPVDLIVYQLDLHFTPSTEDKSLT